MLPCRYGNSTIEPWPAGHILLRFACIMGKCALNHQYPWAYCPHIPVTWLVSESAPTWGCSMGPRRSESQDSIKWSASVPRGTRPRPPWHGVLVPEFTSQTWLEMSTENCVFPPWLGHFTACSLKCPWAVWSGQKYPYKSRQSQGVFLLLHCSLASVVLLC